MRFFRRFCILGILLSVLFAPHRAKSQSDDSGWTYHNFVFDKTFRIGAINVNDTVIAKDLKFDFIEQYGFPLPLDTGTRALYQRYNRSGLHIVSPTYALDWIAKNTYCIEHYAGGSDSIQKLDFGQKQFAALNIAPVNNGLLWGYILPTATSADSLLLASRPRYFHDYKLKQSDTALYTRIGMPDSSTWFQFSIAMKAGDMNPAWGPDTPLLYMILYRRNLTGQKDSTSCRCNMYSPFDTLRVTKARWSNTNLTPDAGDGYKNATFMVNLAGRGLLELPSYPNGVAASSNPAGLNYSCDSLLRKLRIENPSAVPAGSYVLDWNEESDLHVSIYPTRITPITFLRTRVAQHLFTVLKDKTHFNGMIDTVGRQLLADTTLDSVLLRYTVMDEPDQSHFRSFGILSSRLQRAIYNARTTEKRGGWITFNSNADALRALSGDFDSTKIRIVQSMASDLYLFGPDPLPMAYSDTGRMDPRIVNGLFKNLTLFNTTTDHRRYTEQTAGKFSTFRQHNLVSSGVSVRASASYVGLCGAVAFLRHIGGYHGTRG